MGFDMNMFHGLAKEMGLNVNFPEIADALSQGYQSLLVSGEVTTTRARDYLMGFHHGRLCKGTELIYATLGPHDVHSD